MQTRKICVGGLTNRRFSRRTAGSDRYPSGYARGSMPWLHSVQQPRLHEVHFCI